MKIKIEKSTITLILTATFCCLLWGSAFPFIKIGYELLGIEANDWKSQILFAGIRFTGAGVLTILFGSIISGKLLVPSKGSIAKIPVLSMFQTVLQYVFFYIGLANTTATKSSIINSMSVFFAVLISSLAFKTDKITVTKAIGCLIGFSGSIIVNITDGGFAGEFSISGEGFILLSSLSYALSSVFLKKYSDKENPVVLSGYQFLLGGIIMCTFAVLLSANFNSLPLKAIILITYLAALSAVAYTLWGLLLKKHNVSTVAAFGFMTPIFGCILSALILNEAVAGNAMKIVISLILVSFGIILVNINYSHHKEKKDES